ncbi:MAG TPA: hypothetical protein VMB91_12225 [Solirubrobacteraceae bacterium]|nr:hypothetical protein [Solirubrobacteraceae bacterium]
MIRRLGLTATILTLGLAGCGSSSHSSSNSSASAGSGASGSGSGNATQVALEPSQRAAITFTKDAGTAFTTFDRAILVPYQHGAFKPNSAALASAGATALAVAKEIHEATLAAEESPQLVALRAPMKSLDEGFQAALAKLKTGKFNFGEIQAASVAIASIRGAAAQSGLSIPG